MSLTRATANVITNPLLFTGSLTIGTSDGSALNLQTGGVTRVTISSTGNITGTHIQNLGTADSPAFNAVSIAGMSMNSPATNKLAITSVLGVMLNSINNPYSFNQAITFYNVASPATTIRFSERTSFSTNVGIGTSSPNAAYLLDVNGSVNIGANLMVLGNVTVSQHLQAATKSFLIPNQTTGGKLQYGCVESPQHDVYVRGKTSSSIIDLPPEWQWLVSSDSVTVSLTPVGKPFTPYLMNADNTQVVVGGVEGTYNYVIYGERKDVEKLVVNIEPEEAL